MKKTLLFIVAVTITGAVMAGGLVTNTNHSAAFTRMQCRDATLGVDAAYFNPAGMTRLSKGIHFSVSNQTISQTRLIETNFPLLSTYPDTKTYEGTIFAPIFPAVYAVLNLGKIAVSAGFNPIGGGGGATFEDGVPQIEYSPALLASSLSGAGVSGYELEANFEASSIYFGYQVNVAYALNDKLSVAVGGRFVTAKNTYNGYLRNVNLNFNSTMTPVATVFNTLSATATGTAATIQPIIDGGAGGFTLAQLVTAGQLTALQQAQLEGGLQALGIDPTGLTAAQVQGAYTAAATDLGGKAVVYGNLMDQEADVTQTASGFAPIISVNFTPIEMLNIAIKYEGKTSLEFTNETVSDFITAVDPVTGAPTASMFPNGYKYNADIPAQLVVGAMLTPTNKIMVTGGVHYFFDKGVDYSSGMDVEMIDKNFISYALGVEYGMSDMLKFSVGYGGTSTGVNELYQSDIRHSLNTSSFAAGFGLSLTSMIEINVGGSYTMYTDGSYDFTKSVPPAPAVPFTENYDRSVWLVGVGVDLHF